MTDSTSVTTPDDALAEAGATEVPSPRTPSTAADGAAGHRPLGGGPGAGDARSTAPDRMTPRERLALVLLLGTQFVLAIDFSILNVALPSIGVGVGVGEDDLQWIATTFALPAAGFTLLFARVADLAGRRRMFLAGLVVLIGASLLGGLAQEPTELYLARVGQGLAAAIAIPAALSLLVTTFPEGPVRERALGLNGALLPAGFTVGALVGGLLTSYLSWRWAFLVNVPIALVILIVAPRVVSGGRARSRERLDVPGALTVTAGLVAFVYGVSSGGEDGWARASVWIWVAVGVVLLVAFWRIEAVSPHPLASLQVLRMRTVGWGNLGGFTVFAMGSSIVFLLTLYLQRVLDYSAVTTGLIFGVPGTAAFVAGLVAPRILTVLRPPLTLVLGLLLQGACALALAFAGPDRGALTLVLAASVVGFFGHACGIVAYLVTSTSGLPDGQQGLATGLTTMTQQVALTLGIPIFSAVATARTATLAADGGRTAPEATLGGLQLALALDGVVTLVLAALIAVFLSGLRPAAGRPAAG